MARFGPRAPRLLGGAAEPSACGGGTDDDDDDDDDDKRTKWGFADRRRRVQHAFPPLDSLRRPNHLHLSKTLLFEDRERRDIRLSEHDLFLPLLVSQISGDGVKGLKLKGLSIISLALICIKERNNFNSQIFFFANLS